MLTAQPWALKHSKENTQRQRSLDISLGKEESLEKGETQNADVNSWHGLMSFLILTIKCGRVHPQTCSRGLTVINIPLWKRQ